MQRVDNPLNIDPQRLVDIYFTWLPSYMKPFIHVNVDGDKVVFSIASYLTILKLIKSEQRSTDNRVLYYVDGGLLVTKI